MPRVRPPLDKEEFLALSNQKADDWREITRISASFLGIAGAFFTAGLAKGSAWVIVLSPIPLFLGVLQMTRNARLQLQMITYLAVFSPFVETSWEKDIAAARPRFWQEADKSRVAARIEQLGWKHGKALARHMTNPSAWDLWLVIAVLVGLGVDSVPLFVGLGDDLAAFGMGLLVIAAGALLICRDIARIEPERADWQALWERHKDGTLDDPAATAELFAD
jgi:hypothetical protein